jgi:F0F1-type ATP synthase epsilon subunit
MAAFHFELVSPERLIFSGEVVQVVVPGSEGAFTVLDGHAPMMSTIRPGAIAIYEADSNSLTRRVFIEGVKLHVARDNAYYYPDVIVSCDPSLQTIIGDSMVVSWRVRD